MISSFGKSLPKWRFCGSLTCISVHCTTCNRTFPGKQCADFYRKYKHRGESRLAQNLSCERRAEECLERLQPTVSFCFILLFHPFQLIRLIDNIFCFNLWPSAYFWPLLGDGPARFKTFVREVFALPVIKDLILEGPGQRQIYKSHPSVFHGCPKFRVSFRYRHG